MNEGVGGLLGSLFNPFHETEREAPRSRLTGLTIGDSFDPDLEEIGKQDSIEQYLQSLQGMQMGGMTGVSNPLPYQIGGLSEAVQDETAAHHNIDRLMFENELEQQPQYTMSEYEEGYDPAREWGEGMLPFGAGIKLLHKLHPYGWLRKYGLRTEKDVDKFLERTRKIKGKRSPYEEGKTNIDMQQYRDWPEELKKGEILRSSPKRSSLGDIYDEEGLTMDLVDVLESQGMQMGGMPGRRMPQMMGQSMGRMPQMGGPMPQMPQKPIAPIGRPTPYNIGGSVSNQPLSYQMGGILKYKRSPFA